MTEFYIQYVQENVRGTHKHSYVKQKKKVQVITYVQWINYI